VKTGTIKKFDAPRGFGFIVPAEGGEEVFIHVSDVRHPPRAVLAQGDLVEYEEAEGRKGLKAINVSLIGQKA
jgi:CspA family cold shock protein